MSALSEAVRTLLEADGTLTGILTGGIFDASELDRQGLTLFDAARDSVGRLQPVAVLRWRTSTVYGPDNFDGERRFLHIYMYENAGTASIDQAKRRLKELLHRKQVSANGFGVGWINWVSDQGEFVDTQLGGASADMSRYEVIYTRR